MKKSTPSHIQVKYEIGTFTRLPTDANEAKMFNFLVNIGMYFVKGVKPKERSRSEIQEGVKLDNNGRMYYYCEATFRQNNYIVKPAIFLDSASRYDCPMITLYVIHTDTKKNKKRALFGKEITVFLDELGNDIVHAVENKN